MPSDQCARFQHFEQRIDELLVAGLPVEEEQSLREHIRSCAQCRDHFTAGNRAIASLADFSFHLDPAVAAKVKTSLAKRARQLDDAPLTRRRLILICLVALGLTTAGSLLDLQFDSLIAALLDIQKAQARDGMLHFWILPTLLFLLLFPILPLLLAGGRQQLERTCK